MSAENVIADLAEKMKAQLEGFSADDANRAAALAVAVLGCPKPEFDNAVDWLLNSSHTGDQDIQNAFWALADGLITTEEADKLDAAEIRERRSQAKTSAASLT